MKKRFCVLQKKVLSFGPNRTVKVRPNSSTEPNVRSITSLSGHLSNIDEIDKFNIKVLNWIAWMFWPSYKTLTPPKKFHHRLALFNYMKKWSRLYLGLIKWSICRICQNLFVKKCFLHIKWKLWNKFLSNFVIHLLIWMTTVL